MDTEKIKDLLLSTHREGMKDLIECMDEYGFFEAPCSTRYHLSCEGGLAKHSLNVYEAMVAFDEMVGGPLKYESIIICALLHDLGKIGQYDKPAYIPNMLKGIATKANPNPEPYQSTSKPYAANPDLLYIDHEVRSIAIASRYIELTEEEQQAILWHNGLYGNFKYQIPGKETPLYLILHFADMWASRVVEREDGEDEENKDA